MRTSRLGFSVELSQLDPPGAAFANFQTLQSESHAKPENWQGQLQALSRNSANHVLLKVFRLARDGKGHSLLEALSPRATLVPPEKGKAREQRCQCKANGKAANMGPPRDPRFIWIGHPGLK